jgi:plasmid stabilization system protein ParE
VPSERRIYTAPRPLGVATECFHSVTPGWLTCRKIFARNATLPETPRVGRIVPELSDPDIREVPVHAWRVIYQLRGADLYVLTLVHKRRAPGPEDLRG